jgi:hypothetical protein
MRKFNDDVEANGLARMLDVGMQINADVDQVAFQVALAPAYDQWRQQLGDLIEGAQAGKVRSLRKHRAGGSRFPSRSYSGTVQLVRR